MDIRIFEDCCQFENLFLLLLLLLKIHCSIYDLIPSLMNRKNGNSGKPKSNSKTHLSFVHLRVRLRIWIAWHSQLVLLCSCMSWWMHCVRYTHRLYGIRSGKYSDSIARYFQLSDLTFSATLSIFLNYKFSDTILYDYFIINKKKQKRKPEPCAQLNPTKWQSPLCS